MKEKCQIFNTIERIRAASYCNIGFTGGSLTAPAGVGNSAVTSWRRLFVRYIYEKFHRVYHCQPSEVNGAIGAMESFGAVFMLERNILPNLPVMVFVEFAVNDRGCPDKNLVRKGMEGIIRQLRSCPTHPDVVIVGAAVRPGTDMNTGDQVDLSVHREVADYYGAPFVDVQDYILKTLKARGQKWDDVAIVFETNDNCHLNDYGNLLWFEALREWFEKQWQLFDLDPCAKPSLALPAPIVSDEFQYTKLVNPAKPNPLIKLEGRWIKRDFGPWYLDDILVGRPGDKLTYTFTGRAIGAICLIHCNGLKIEARLDGQEVAGPYTNFGIEFGKFFMLKHGMENREHVLELTVAQPQKRQNKLEDPTGQIGYLCVAEGPKPKA